MTPFPISELVLTHSGAIHYLRKPSGEITWISQSARRVLQAPPDTLIGQPLTSLFVKGQLSKERWKNLQALHQQTDSPAQIEVEIQGPRPSPIWVELRETRIHDPALEPCDQIIGVGVDVNDRKFRESHLQQAQRLENLGLLAAGIAHDLNNILSPILMAGSLMRTTAQDARQLRMIEILQSSAERGSRIVRQILGFSRGNEGERGPIDPRHILREVLLVVQETFPRNIEVQDDIPRELGHVDANPTQIHQLLLNLCINARDALPDGGILKIIAQTCQIPNPPPDIVVNHSRQEWLKITVDDNGTGISPDVIDQIWLPFYTTKPRGDGTGLGLSTVRGLVSLHGGFITVDSELGQGTAFHVHLPLIDIRPDEPAAQASLRARPGNGERILVVDDEPSLRDMILDTLTSRGYHVTAAANGVEGLAAANLMGHTLSLVITDVHMPHMSGDIMVNVLKRIYPDLPIISISGHPNVDKNWAGAEQAQPDASLAKPFTGPQLVHQVCKLLPPKP